MTPPKGHKWLICTCPICTEIRKFKSAKKKRPSMLKHLYEARRNGHIAIFGTALGGLSAFWEFVLIKLLGNKKIRFWGIFNYKNPFKHIYEIPIRNGYALVLLSPFFLSWWILITAFLTVVGGALISACAIYIAIWLTCFCGISVFYIPVLAYSIFPELPASLVNKDLRKIDKRKVYNHKKQPHIGMFIFLFFSPIGWFILLWDLILSSTSFDKRIEWWLYSANNKPCYK